MLRVFKIISTLFSIFITFALLFVFSTSSIQAAEGDAIWAKSSISGPSDSYFYDVTTDLDGNIYAVGEIDGDTQFDFGNGVTVTSAIYSWSTLIVKYNSDGVAQWARTSIVAPNNSYFEGVSTDSLGNVYVVGYIRGTDTFDFGNSVTVYGANSSNNPLIIKYNSAGVAQWAKSTVTGPNTHTNFNKISTDSDGNSFVVGTIGIGTYDFGNSVTISSTTGSILIKYNSAGVAQWAVSATGPNRSLFLGVSIDLSNNVFISGYIENNSEFSFGNGVSVSGSIAAGINPLIVKYNSAGVAQWARSLLSGGATSAQFKDLDTDSNGNIYVAGYIRYNSEYGFGNSVVVTGGAEFGDNSVVVKYNDDGVAQWARSTSISTNTSIFESIDVDTQGNIYAFGNISSTDTFNYGDGVTISGVADGENPYILKYNSSGVVGWARTSLISPLGITGYEVAVSNNGEVYWVGDIEGTGQFTFSNNITLSAPSVNANVFIIKYEGVAPAVESTPSVAVISAPSLSSSAPTSCSGEMPMSFPNLFQIDSSGTSAKLFFSPIVNASNYYVSYSTKPSAEEHGVLATLTNQGVQSFVVNHLNPNTVYYFKVRGQNGCVPGAWSNILKVTASNKSASYKTSFYRNSIFKMTGTTTSTKPVQKTVVNKQVVSVPTPKPMPTGTPTSVSPSKSCFLWWCW